MPVSSEILEVNVGQALVLGGLTGALAWPEWPKWISIHQALLKIQIALFRCRARLFLYTTVLYISGCFPSSSTETWRRLS
jgi:hypothetical protein